MSDKIINLYGIRTTYTPNSYNGESTVFGSVYVGSEDEEKVLIATFDTIKQAKKFVESCKLKTPKRNNWMNDESYKRKSLLGGYGFVEIEPHEEPDSVPHNPQGLDK